MSVGSDFVSVSSRQSSEVLMRRKEIQVLIAVIDIVSKRYPKDQDVQLICDAFEKVLIKLEGNS